ncbi:MAG TPA: type VI secretion system tube protein TssD [Mucilaginibacter sp.]|jgi:type VI secretion system secreted protein Hcp|nr:type VI secretion system tube protein TssD [Mucilaginibacter sp.]
MKKIHFCHFLVLFVLCQFTFLVASAQSSQPVIAYVSIEGQKSGIFKGNAITEGNEGKIECIGFRYLISVPHDPESGRSSGKRQHMPVVLIKNIDYSTPQLLQAASTNETLKSVVIEFYKKASDGRLQLYYKITLSNASISQLSQYGGTALGDNGYNLNSTGNTYEEVSMTYQNIQFEHVIGNTVASDDWNR